jgi:hypothetical protein
VGAAAALVATLAVSSCGASAHETHTSASRSLDLTRLRLGDGRLTTSGPRRGYVYSCRSGGGGPQAPSGPWISGSTWDFTRKPTVDGSVAWPNARYRVRRSGSQRTIRGNGLPSHTTGVFPIAQSDDAYQYDRNPNRIAAQTVDVTLPSRPRKAAAAACVPGGPIGVLKSGAVLFNALDAAGADAPAHELQDRCGGHPQQQGQYHYHSLPRCFSTGSSRAHSRRIGWAFDGFPIFGPRGRGGRYLRNGDLDACHGHTHTIRIDGRRRRLYHYHATMEYPYTLACFRGRRVQVDRGGGPGAGPPGGGPPPPGAARLGP